MKDIVIIPGGWIGYVKYPPVAASEGAGEPVEEEEWGAVLAMRNNGDEVLFAGESEDPVKWIPIGDFVVDSKRMALPEDDDKDKDDKSAEGENTDNEVRKTPPGTTPFGRRRREETTQA